jgi:hypothetical protein
VKNGADRVSKIKSASYEKDPYSGIADGVNPLPVGGGYMEELCERMGGFPL